MLGPDEHRRPTILIIDSKPVFGGGQRMIAEVVQALEAYRVLVLRPMDAPEDDGVYGPATVLRQYFPAWPAHLSRWTGMVSALPGALRAADRLGRLLQRERPSLVVVNDLYAAIPLVLLRNAGLRFPWCMWIHSCDFPQGAAVQWLLRSSQALIGVSEAAAAPWRRLGFPQVRTIRNAVSLPKTGMPPPIHRVAWTVLVAGRLDANKNVVGLIRAWAMVRDVLERSGPAHLLVAGDGPEAQPIASAIIKHGLQGVVRCVGWCGDLLSLMTTVDAVVLVSYEEALGLTLVEAQQLGRAVMGTSVGGIPEVIQDGITGILARSPAPEDVAEALVRLRQEGSRLAPAGQASASQRFSPHRFRAEVGGLVAALLHTGRVPPPTLRDYADVTSRAVRSVSSLRPPVISVITVVRNGLHVLEDCCSSIRVQTVAGIEHIIVDGASQDGTPAWLRQHGDTLGAWISEPDQGISDAFNKGIAIAQGEFIALVNADDRWLPETAAMAIATMRQHPEAQWCYGGCDFTIGGVVVLHRDGDPEYGKVIHRWMPTVNHPTVVMRRSAYERLGLFRTDLRLAMDYDLLLRFHRAGARGVCIPRTLASMELGGVSTGVGVFRAHREAAQVAIAHGRPWMLAQVDRLRQDVLPCLRQAAIRAGLQGPWRRWKAVRSRYF